MLVIEGAGLLDKVIDKLPFELHIPSYKFCGPGTRLEKRLRRGDIPKNKLDALCRTHDIAYAEHKDLADRHQADKVLEDGAWERVKASDSGFGEKTAALLVTGAMKVKRKMGAGCSPASRHRRRRRPRRKNNNITLMPFSTLVRQIRHDLPPLTMGRGAASTASAAAALKVARNIVRKKKVKTPRVIPIPKKGGLLPLLPLFAGLSAIGTLVGGAAGVAKTVTDAQAKTKQLREMKRHNMHMESIALGKKGSGMYLRRKPTGGFGLYLSRQQTKN